MLQLSNISYTVAGHPLLTNASAIIPTGHKVGVVGRNGTGKTTLFRLIREELALETGTISLPPRARIGSVAQEVPGNDVSLLDTVLAADTERAALIAESDTATDSARIAEIQTRLVDIDAWSAEARASSVLRGLGFSTAEQNMPCSTFSGGWRMRVALAAVLFAQPDLLLLDEPTNYLDLEGALWLESYLAKYPHTMLIISHDRGLLNRAVGSILHLENHKLTLYQGPYDRFAATYAARQENAESEAKKQEARRAHLQSYVDRFRYKADKARQAQSRLKALAKMAPVMSVQDVALRAFSFPQPDELAPPILQIDNGSVGYDGRTILKRLNLRIDQDDRIALLGRNGEGKSTLSKLLAGHLPTLEGHLTRTPKLRIGYFAQHQVDELHLDETPLDHIRRLRPDEPPAHLRARLGGFGITTIQADTLVGQLSGGQKARLSLLLATLDAPHLLILDEPTNHLDIESREALVEALTVYTGAVILVSHDMHLLSLVANQLWLVCDGTVTPYDGDIESYRQKLLTRDNDTKPVQTVTPMEKPTRPTRDTLLKLRQEVRKCETRIDKLNEMRDKITTKLADPTFYADNNHAEAAEWQKKYTEVLEGLERAETLWLSALERLETAEGRIT